MESHVSLGTTDAQLAIRVIADELGRRGKAAVIAVGDDHGELIGLLRVDGAPLPSITIAANKVWTSARERKPSLELGRSSRDPEQGFDLANYGDPRFLGWGGGLPVVLNRVVVGAVGVSGLTQEEDAELAEMGVKAILEAAGGAAAS